MASPPPPSLGLLTVNRHKPELISPSGATPHELKLLSDVDDQEGLRFQVPFLLFYPNNPSMKGREDPARVVKEALAEALVYYYPLAGRIQEGPNRKLAVDCTGEGILFVEADADVGLEELCDSMLPSCGFADEVLCDVAGSGGIVGCPLLLVQVTRLKCGGFILGIRLNHAISDSLGVKQFLEAAAELTGGAPAPSRPPVWQREILCARDPPRVTCMHPEFEDVVDTGGAAMTLDPNNMAHRSFFFSPREVASIKKLLPHHLVSKSSTYELLTACLWKCRTIALEIEPEDVVRLSCMISARGKRGLGVPHGYYGNTTVFATVLSKAGHLCNRPLGYAVELVKKAKEMVSEEYVRSSIDVLVIKGRPKYTTVWNYVVADMTKVGFEEVDFGWGKPVYGGIPGAFPLISIYVKYKTRKGEEGIVVPIMLPERAMQRFQQELEKMTDEEIGGDDHYGVDSISVRSKL
ncbi:alcohol acyltransferase 17-like isoform X2 [Syzygium oleosum]|uniref:alcohol acyltransferase 17-like isoform X2 n=1 Tax=Syzygium oleosum TaxID=219896 RepID=UPI0011D27171|nr:alcohol acyltransferase 17-like isoform X2 [Syzygium oleosum]